MIDKAFRAIGALVSILGAVLSPSWEIKTLTVLLGVAVIASTLHSVREQLHDLVHWLRPRELIPLLEIKKMATERGWDLSLQIVDLARALQEAGARGLLDFYGRTEPEKEVLFKDWWKNIPRVRIPADEWKNLLISPDNFFYNVKQDNLLSGLATRDPFGESAYRDVYVKQKGVRRWFRRYAREFRGQYQQEKKAKASAA